MVSRGKNHIFSLELVSVNTEILKKSTISWIYFLSFKKYLLCEALLSSIRQNFPSVEPCIYLYNLALVTEY